MPDPTKAPRSLKPTPRADYGAPVDGYVAAQTPEHQQILEAARTLLTEVAPEAVGMIKWGFPVFEIGGRMWVALRATKAGVSVLLALPPDTVADPEGKLTGTAKEMRNLKLTRLTDLDRSELRGWLQVAADRARGA